MSSLCTCVCVCVCTYIQDEKCTPLHLAAQNGHVQAVDTLLKLGADINAVTIVG